MRKWFFRSADDRLEEAEKESNTESAESDIATDQGDTETTKTTKVHDPDEGGDAQEASSGDSHADRNSDGAKAKRPISLSRVIAHGLLPGLALLMAIGAGYLKWQDSAARDSQTARIESLAAAKESTIALLSYQPDSVEKDLGAARNRLRGTFKESYTQLTHDVVIPGAKEKHISAVATVPAAASVSATPGHAVAVLFVDQTTVVNNDAPTDTASSVRVTLDKVDGRWLISEFDPI